MPPFEGLGCSWTIGLPAYHLKIRRQIGKVGARLDLEESRAVAHIPKIEIGRILGLHAQRCRSTQYFESVTATHEEHRLRRILRHIINAGWGGTKVLHGDISGERRPPRELVIGIDRTLDSRLTDLARTGSAEMTLFSR